MPASDWAELCTAVVTWVPIASRDAYGKPSYVGSTPQTFAGRRVFRQVRKSSGSSAVEFVNGSVIWILGTPAVGNEDQVYVAGDAEPYPPILNVERYPDENGDLFVKVFLGSANG